MWQFFVWLLLFDDLLLFDELLLFVELLLFDELLLFVELLQFDELLVFVAFDEFLFFTLSHHPFIIRMCRIFVFMQRNIL